MRKSILLRRIIMLLLSAVLVSGLLSAGIYIFVTQKMYAKMRADELTPIARAVADMVADAQQSGESEQGIRSLLKQNNKDFLGALLYVYDASGEFINSPPEPDIGEDDKTPYDKKDDFWKDGENKAPPEPPEDEPDLTQVISYDLKAILTGREISAVRTSDDGQSYLVVGVPIENNEAVTGAVIFTKPMRELSDAMNGMNLTLLISTLAAFLIMLVPSYFLVKQLTMPIRRMEDVAHAMARGDFSVRADDSQKGEFGELGRAMNHFAVESERLEQTRRDYVANVSHELRTPIAAVRAMGETLRDGMAKSEEKQVLFYNNIVHESMRLSSLVDDLLELSRLQSGTEIIKKTRFDLREVIQSVSDIYSHIAEESEHQFVLSVNMEEAVPVFSNPDRIEQVLVILLDNVIKHTQKDGVITLLTVNHTDYIEIYVKDTGTGIPEEDILHIFERFYKVDKSHSDRGTGLGLSIAQEVIRELGESIKVGSGLHGTNFIFTVHKN